MSADDVIRFSEPMKFPEVVSSAAEYSQTPEFKAENPKTDSRKHAIAYTFGGGVDLPFKPRWSLRVGADAVGSQYFSTHQWGPKASVGVVFKF